MTDLIHFALSVTGPILLLLVLGVLLRRVKIIDEHFIQVGNRLVFAVALPALLFFSVASQPLEAVLNPKLVLFGCVITCLIVIFLLLASRWLVTKEKSGVFIQGAFRSNMGIIGLALVVNAYGEQIIPKAGIYMAALTILYNVLSVWLLGKSGDAHWQRMLKNPLILAILAGVAVSLSGLQIPPVILKSSQYLTDITLPLALLCIGGSLSWQSFKSNHRDVAIATSMKLVLVPVFAILISVAVGFRGEDLGILFLMIAAPSATASYVMAAQMTGFGSMAAEIVALTTMLSPLTLTVGLTALKFLQLI